MNWVEALTRIHSVWKSELFRPNVRDYPLTVHLFLAIAKGVAGDILGAALQLRRAVRFINRTKSDDEYSKGIVLDFVEEFKTYYAKEYDTFDFRRKKA